MAYFLQRLAGFFRIRIVHAGAAANLVDGLLHGARHSAGVLQRAAEVTAVPAGRQHEEFAGDVGVAALPGKLVGNVKELCQLVREVHVALGIALDPAAAGRARCPVQRAVDSC